MLLKPTPPTEPGLYWLRVQKKDQNQVVHVARGQNGNLTIHGVRWPFALPLETLVTQCVDARWAGPLEEVFWDTEEQARAEKRKENT